MGLVLDSSALVELERADDAVERLWSYHTPLYLSAITVAEMLIGIGLADTKARADWRRERFARIQEITEIIPFGADLAREYAEIFCELRRAGKAIPQNDLIIAATALFHSHVVLVGSGGESHFAQVPRLSVVKL